MTFSSRRLQRVCNDKAAMVRRWGRPLAEGVAQCLQELDALEQLGDLPALPHLRVMSENSAQIAVQGAGGVRLLLERANDLSGSRDLKPWQEVTSIVVVDVSVMDEQESKERHG